MPCKKGAREAVCGTDMLRLGPRGGAGQIVAVDEAADAT